MARAQAQRKLVVHLDHTVSLAGRKLGYVYPDPMDKTVNHGWCYSHVSRISLRDLHPDWPWERRYQSSFTKRGAAESLARLDREIAQRGQAPQ